VSDSHSKEIVTWQAPEFEYRHKGVSWYWITIICAVLLVAIAVWQRNFLFGLFVVIAEILVLTWGARNPSLITFKAFEKELIINERERYPWGDFQSFTPEEIEGGSSVILRFRRRIRPPIRIFVPQDKMEGFLQCITPWCAQTDEPSSFVDALEEIFRF